jgi:hypothetical protein
MGSGTTAVEAALVGMLPYGVEIDPFARLVSSVRLFYFTAEDLEELSRAFHKIRRSWRSFDADCSLAPRLTNVEYWFDRRNFDELLKLKNAIYSMLDSDDRQLAVFRVILADMIRPCSKAERQTLKPYISKKYPKQPSDVGETFEKSFKATRKALREFSEMVGRHVPPIKWLGFDGTQFEAGRVKIDVAITSPPYINALDYVRCVKLESSWIDTGDDGQFLELRKGHVGEAQRAHSQIDGDVSSYFREHVNKIAVTDPARSRIVAGYFQDMYNNLLCTYAALKDGGEYHMIVGDSSIRGVRVPTHKILLALAESIGYVPAAMYRYRIRDHRTSIPRNGHGGKIKFEVVVSLRKPG